MTTEQTAQQLELAAQIIRTGHPWKSSPQAPDTDIYSALRDGFEIRPILATPPDGRPLHNPDNLTAEQVGAGFRLTLKDESAHKDAELWNNYDKKWVDRLASDVGSEYGKNNTYRLPFSVPWPEPQPDPYAELKKAHAEGKVIQWHTGTSWIDHILPDNWEPIWIHPVKDYRIKPDAPPFQLPPHPPGMQWHRTDGWKAEDLPPGTRPLAEGELLQESTDYFTATGRDGFAPVKGISGSYPACPSTQFYRTTRPLTFSHAGKSWTYHCPGDPMPCDGASRIRAILADGTFDTDANTDYPARSLRWDDQGSVSVVGWRYAEPLTREVELGPEDVPPCSVFRLHDDDIGYEVPCEVAKEGVTFADDTGNFTKAWGELTHWQINRSIPLTGKWNPTLWEPCHKTVPQNG